MFELLDLDEVKRHLHILDDDDFHNDDLELKIRQASAVVMQHIKLSAIPESWITNHSPETVELPWDVHAATMLMVGELFLNRESASANVLSDTCKDLLRAYRDPTLA